MQSARVDEVEPREVQVNLVVAGVQLCQPAHESRLGRKIELAAQRHPHDPRGVDGGSQAPDRLPYGAVRPRAEPSGRHGGCGLDGQALGGGCDASRLRSLVLAGPDSKMPSLRCNFRTLATGREVAADQALPGGQGTPDIVDIVEPDRWIATAVGTLLRRLPRAPTTRGCNGCQEVGVSPQSRRPDSNRGPLHYE